MITTKQPYMEKHIDQLLDWKEFDAFRMPMTDTKVLKMQVNGFMPDSGNRLVCRNFMVMIHENKGEWFFSYECWVTFPDSLESDESKETAVFCEKIEDKDLVEKIERYWEEMSIN